MITADVTINEPPTILKENETPIQYFDSNPSGSLLLLPCVAKGSLPLTYIWKVNQSITVNTNDNAKYQLQDGNLMFVRPVLRTTIGIYQCFAQNTFGIALTKEVEVRIYLYPDSSNDYKNFTAMEGSSYSLLCTPPSGTDPKPFFKWQTVADFRDTNSVDIVLNNNVRIDENGTLYFSSVQKSDNQQNRLYRCQLQNPFLNADIRFVGYSKLSVSPNTVPQRTMKLIFKSFYPIIPLVGMPVTLYCFFEGATDIVINWELPSGNTPSGTQYEILGNKLTIKELTKMDSGNYNCVGRSALLQTTLKEIISINVKEKPAFIQQPFDITSSQGTNIVFNCSASADPAAMYTWYRNGIDIFKTNPFRSNLELSADKTQLTVKNLCKNNCQDTSDLAVYQCQANNKFGSILANGYVNVLDATKITFISKDILYNPSIIPEFICKATTDEETMSLLTYNWLFNGKIVNNGNFNTTDTSSLRIPLSESSRYIGQWTCNATDSYSYDLKTVQLYQAAGANVWPYWWIPLVVILVLLIFILLVCIICCCLYNNRGDAYPIDDIEHKVGNNPKKKKVPTATLR